MRFSQVDNIFKIVDKLKVEESVGEDNVDSYNEETEDVDDDIVPAIDLMTDLV